MNPLHSPEPGRGKNTVKRNSKRRIQRMSSKNLRLFTRANLSCDRRKGVAILQSRFGKGGAVQKLGLVQIIVEVSAIRGGFRNT